MVSVGLGVTTLQERDRIVAQEDFSLERTSFQEYATKILPSRWMRLRRLRVVATGLYNSHF